MSLPSRLLRSINISYIVDIMYVNILLLKFLVKNLLEDKDRISKMPNEKKK